MPARGPKVLEQGCVQGGREGSGGPEREVMVSAPLVAGLSLHLCSLLSRAAPFGPECGHRHPGPLQRRAGRGSSPRRSKFLKFPRRYKIRRFED